MYAFPDAANGVGAKGSVRREGRPELLPGVHCGLYPCPVPGAGGERSHPDGDGPVIRSDLGGLGGSVQGAAVLRWMAVQPAVH